MICIGSVIISSAYLYRSISILNGIIGVFYYIKYPEVNFSLITCFNVFDLGGIIITTAFSQPRMSKVVIDRKT